MKNFLIFGAIYLGLLLVIYSLDNASRQTLDTERLERITNPRYIYSQEVKTYVKVPLSNGEIELYEAY